MEVFLKAIANFGFPIAVASYLLIRMEKTIQNLTSGVKEWKKETESLKNETTGLKDEVTGLKDQINKLCDRYDRQ